MLSRETLETYRRMTPSERLQLTFSAMHENEKYLLYGPEEQVARKFQRLEEQNDSRNLALLTSLSRAEKLHPSRQGYGTVDE